ncbi:hypothetical protein BPNPMPFG_002559 [Mesorhizobium sp. AR07]|uniref:hypothetical protein n=1 Tax=Mesorhizobium sp. AR07 TaxID=2865838 RepID=UPI002160D4F5|nr:hypothetical protein [Mesorhizobium sp. AR07]UVK46845.1 hypothetical protein BPNPMPFG_002559 [Mesorhizobium sp. AR07]
MFKAVSVAGLAAVIGLFAAGLVDAKGGHSMHTASPCAPDYKRLCSKTPVGRAASCLKKHISELSPACKAKYSK